MSSNEPCDSVAAERIMPTSSSAQCPLFTPPSPFALLLAAFSFSWPPEVEDRLPHSGHSRAGVCPPVPELTALGMGTNVYTELGGTKEYIAEVAL